MPDDDSLANEKAAASRTVRSDDPPSADPDPGRISGAFAAATGSGAPASRVDHPPAGPATPGLRPAAELAVRRVREDGVRRAAGLAVRRAVALAASRARQLAAGPWVRELIGIGNPARLALVASVLCCLGLVAAVDANQRPDGPTGAELATAGDRVAASRPEQTAGGRGSADPDRPDPDVPAVEQPAEPPAPVDPGPVAGLSQVQMDNAKAIVRTGRDMGMSRRALIIGVATAMQESNLLNRASEVLPESKNYPHQGSGWDHDSVGLFQQRTSSGWGPVHRLMDPAYATVRFFEALRRVPNWDRMRLTEAAQAVQVSAYPEHYAKHEPGATKVVDAIVPAIR